MATNTTIDQKQRHHGLANDTGASSGGQHLANSVIGYSNQVDEITTYLEKKEEELQQRPTEVVVQDFSFNQLLDEYGLHEKYMTELCEYCHSIMQSKEEGQELRDNESLSEEERDEVGIQMDAMLVFYDRLKILATDRLQMLQRIIDGRQRSKIERLDKWLSFMESKLSSSNNIGPDYDAIQRQLTDVKELRRELEQKQEFLNFISKVIIFDEIDSESMQLHSRSCGSLDEQLEKMNIRWTNICQFVDDRHEKLKKAESIWKVLAIEGPQLYTWLKKIQTDLDDLTEVIQNAANSEADKDFIMKLMARSEKVDQKIKDKQSFYTSLENRVRLDIEKFDDPCSMLVIELEKKLEDMQDNWNSIMRQKRMIDFSIHALLNPNLANQSSLLNSRPMIPIPEPITTLSNKELQYAKSDLLGDGDSVGNHTLDMYDEPLTNSSSTGNEDKESSLQLNGSVSDRIKAFDTSYSSQDTRSIGTNNNVKYKLNSDELSHYEISSTTNLTSPQTTNSAADVVFVGSQDDSTSSFPPCIESGIHALDLNELNRFSEQNNTHGEHNCRVEEWRHSLDSFSNWLRKVEASLEIGSVPTETHARDSLNDCQNSEPSWWRLNIQDQFALIRDVEKRIKTTCQGEFDCLFLQGQQIIEDLLPEIGENEYETNLKDILADIELRYGAVKRCLADRKQELAGRDRWDRLSRQIRDSCNHIINQMSEVIPETEIGVDLITLAQQQDQLMHLKEDAEQNPSVQSSIHEAKSFLYLCDSLQHQYGQQNHHTSLDDDDFVKIWMSFKECKEDIEDQLDRLKLHHSELSQIIQDRLARLDEVHKEMHALQHSIQDLATRLQVAEILRSNWVPLDNLAIEQLSEQLEDLKLYRERLHEVESTHMTMNSIVDWMERFGSPLSQSNLKRVDELNSIWELIQISVDERQREIEQAFDEQSGSEQKFLAQTVADLPGKWERRVATSKVPYFIDHVSNKTVWDHPKFTDLLNTLDECKQYVYSVYRTAMKLRIVQKRLGIDKLMLEYLKEILTNLDTKLKQQAVALTSATTSHNLQPVVTHDTQINIEQIISVLKAIFTKIHNEESPDLDIPVAIDLTLNWLLNLYDSTRTGNISALSLKVGLALMCCATREEKYVYMFELVANQLTNTVDARKLGTLFEICMRPPIYLGENESFGAPDLIEISIRNCFTMSKFNPEHPNCINLCDYLSWLKSEPQFIIWLPVLHRVLISENTVHVVKCRLCKVNPIVGLRYRCLKCFKFNICQKCFLTGLNIYEHPDPNVHQMQEYCYRTGAGENLRDFAKILRNKINPQAIKGTNKKVRN